jgi:hypothetical protein
MAEYLGPRTRIANVSILGQGVCRQKCRQMSAKAADRMRSRSRRNKPLQSKGDGNPIA